MSVQTAFQKCFGFFGEKPIVVESSAGELTSDAGLLPICEFDERIGLTQAIAEALHDPRRQRDVDHPYLEMVRSRVYGVLADYPDQNDHDVLRFDPVFKLIGGRSPADGPLACQSTLSRFENAVDIPSLYRLRDALVDQFIASFAEPPARLTLDVDTYDDPTHGAQQLTFFHGYYDQYQYQPRVVTCAENDLVLMVWLLHGTAAASLGFDDDLRYLLSRLRQLWPDVQLQLRGDSGFGLPLMYDVCEELGVDYTFGVRMNPVLQRASADLLARAVAQYEEQGTPQRLFCAFEYQAGSWPEPRWTIIKCEANSQGTNRRAVVSNRDRRAGVARRLLRRLHRSRGEREPQQGTQVRTRSRPAQRPPLPGKLLPAVSARECVQPAGAAAPHGRFTAECAARRGSPRSACRSGSPPLFQPASRTRSAGRRSTRHLADAVDQSRRGDRRQQSPDPGAALEQLALSPALRRSLRRGSHHPRPTGMTPPSVALPEPQQSNRNQLQRGKGGDVFPHQWTTIQTHSTRPPISFMHNAG